MEIKTTKQDSQLEVRIIGSLNTQTAPDLEKVLEENEEGINRIVLDLAELDYISSAGLRVILVSYNKMDSIDGQLIIKNAQPSVVEIFDMTGFSSILTLE